MRTKYLKYSLMLIVGVIVIFCIIYYFSNNDNKINIKNSFKKELRVKSRKISLDKSDIKQNTIISMLKNK